VSRNVLRKVVGLQVTIREYTPADAEKVFALRKDPRLRGMQYASSILESPASKRPYFNPAPRFPETVGSVLAY
jgi:hypothetical protein